MTRTSQRASFGMGRDPCSMPNCDQPSQTRGLCPTHYARWYRDTLHFYCERCDRRIPEEFLRFGYEAAVETTLCDHCIEELEDRERIRHELEAEDAHPVTDGEVTGEMIVRLGRPLPDARQQPTEEAETDQLTEIGIDLVSAVTDSPPDRLHWYIDPYPFRNRKRATHDRFHSESDVASVSPDSASDRPHWYIDPHPFRNRQRRR